MTGHADDLTPPDPDTVTGLVELLKRAIAGLEAATERQRQLTDRVVALESAILFAVAASPPAPGG